MTSAEPARTPEIAIIGLGVIGGSAALRLRERGTAVTAYAASDADRALAGAAGVAVAPTLDAAVRDVGLVLIAVPLDALGSVAEAVVGAAPSRATILHAGSLQRPEAIGALPEVAARVIGTHPLAGSHRSGFAGASPALYRGATVFVERRADARQREDAELFWSLAGAARIEYADADAHDRAMAWASHLPQLASTALGASLAEVVIESRGERLVPTPGPGARDATRLAMSGLEIWRPILERAPDETLAALRALEKTVGAVRAALERRDWPALEATWERARRWRAGVDTGDRA